MHLNPCRVHVVKQLSYPFWHFIASCWAFEFNSFNQKQNRHGSNMTHVCISTHDSGHLSDSFRPLQTWLAPCLSASFSSSQFPFELWLEAFYSFSFSVIILPARSHTRLSAAHTIKWLQDGSRTFSISNLIPFFFFQRKRHFIIFLLLYRIRLKKSH